MSQDPDKLNQEAQVAPNGPVASDASTANAVESKTNAVETETKDTGVEQQITPVTTPLKKDDDELMRKRQEEEFLKQCQDTYSAMFKGSEKEPWFKPPELNDQGKIQLSFKDDKQTEQFLNEMAEKNPDMGFIVTEGDKVLGYAVPGKGYTKNDENLSFDDCNKKIQAGYAARNEQKQESDLTLRGVAPIGSPAGEGNASPLVNQQNSAQQSETALNQQLSSSVENPIQDNTSLTVPGTKGSGQ